MEKNDSRTIVLLAGIVCITLVAVVALAMGYSLSELDVLAGAAALLVLLMFFI